MVVVVVIVVVVVVVVLWSYFYCTYHIAFVTYGIEFTNCRRKITFRILSYSMNDIQFRYVKQRGSHQCVSIFFSNIRSVRLLSLVKARCDALWRLVGSTMGFRSAIRRTTNASAQGTHSRRNWDRQREMKMASYKTIAPSIFLHRVWSNSAEWCLHRKSWRLTIHNQLMSLVVSFTTTLCLKKKHPRRF